MDPLDPLDPMDFYLWQEVLYPEIKYECPHCGSLFGQEGVAVAPDGECLIAVCPACGAKWRLDEDNSARGTV